MSLHAWKEAGWLQPHPTSRHQISCLFAVVDRDLRDAARGLSPDWQFGIAYHAALKLCTLLLRAEGWRPENNLAPHHPLQALPLILGASRKTDADYLDSCRTRRITAESDTTGHVSPTEAKELEVFARRLRADVMAWIEDQHPEFYPWSY